MGNRTGQRFLRGQVWWIGTKEDHEEYDGYLLSGHRPYVIISNDVCNRNSPILTVAPCTSAEKVLRATRVKAGFNDRDSIIMVEQLKTVNTSELRGYVVTLDDEIMDKVDEAIKVTLGLVEYPEGSDLSFGLVEEPKSAVKVEEVTSKTRRQWSDSDKLTLIQITERDSLETASVVLGLSLATTKQYYSKFKKELEVEEDDGRSSC